MTDTKEAAESPSKVETPAKVETPSKVEMETSPVSPLPETPETKINMSCLKRTDSASKKRKRVDFSPDAPQLKEFEIEDGNRFNKLPSMTKLKAQANKWTSVFSISAAKKTRKVVADEMEQVFEKRKEEEEAKQAAEDKKATAAAELASKEAKKAAEAKTATEPVVDITKLSDEEKEQFFLESAIKAFEKVLSNGKDANLRNMVKDLKATGLMDFIKAKHGAVKKWFLQSEHFGLNVKDNFVSLKGHKQEFLDALVAVLRKAPKNMLRMHALMTIVKAKTSQNGVKTGLRGYPSLEVYVLAHTKEFLVSKKGGFVTIKDHLKFDT